MEKENIYQILKDAVAGLARHDKSLSPLPDRYSPNDLVGDFGIDLVTLPEILGELETRFQGRDLGRKELAPSESLNTMTVGDLVEKLQANFRGRSRNPVIVYVDDEEENLFVFQRKFGKRLTLKTFTDPLQALGYIREESDVALVITDEVMPNLSGNGLCDEVKKYKPHMKFILITGNPNNDEDLMYRSLRQNRFFEFINKPLDLEGKGEEYFAMIQGLTSFDW